MVRKVIWADAAVADLDDVAEYISKDSPAYAATLVLGYLENARSLGSMSERGRIVPEFKDVYRLSMAALTRGNQSPLGYILMPSFGIPPNVPTENLLMLKKAASDLLEDQD